jgi:hypothetical protein
MRSDNVCQSCDGESCYSGMYDGSEPICCSCEDYWRSGPRAVAQLALAVLHSGWKLSERQRLILTARTEEIDLEDIANHLGMTWKRALKIEWRLLTKIETYPPERLPENARRILAQKSVARGRRGFCCGRPVDSG